MTPADPLTTPSQLLEPEPVLVEAAASGLSFTSLPGNTAKIRLILDLARQVSSSGTRLRILDVGAGGRYHPFNMWEPFVPYRESIDLYGVDVANLDATAVRAAELAFPVDLRQGGVQSIVEQFGEQTFDAVVSTQVLEHLRDWRGGVSEMTRVLRPGGRLYVTCDSGDLQRPAAQRAWLDAKCVYSRATEVAPSLKRLLPLSGDWERAPTLDELRRHADSCGLETELVRHYGPGELKAVAATVETRYRLLLLGLEEQLDEADAGEFRLLYLRARRPAA